VKKMMFKKKIFTNFWEIYPKNIHKIVNLWHNFFVLGQCPKTEIKSLVGILLLCSGSSQNHWGGGQEKCHQRTTCKEIK
jgi:hypothetical protein